MAESIVWVLLEIYFSFQLWGNFENSLRIDKISAISLVYYFWGHNVDVLVMSRSGKVIQDPRPEAYQHQN